MVPAQATFQQPSADVERHWYVLQIAPHRENSAKSFLSPSDAEIEEAALISRRLAAHLIARRFRPYVPMMREKRTRGITRRKIVVERPMFPGYGFIKLNFEVDGPRLHFVRAAPGVLGFIQFDGAYMKVPVEVMARIVRAEVDALVPRARAKVFHVGERIKIKEGPFAGFPASVENLDSDELIGLLLDIFGRSVRVSIEEECVEKI
jgi:transcription antitermination factor NusG